MADKHLTVPEPGVREIAHELAYKIAREQLAAVADIEEYGQNDDYQDGVMHISERWIPTCWPRLHTCRWHFQGFDKRPST